MPEEFYQVILYSIIVYLLLLTLTRIIGKKLLAQMTFFDFVVGIIMGSIGGAFIATEIKGFYVLISPVILTMAVLLTGYITLKSVPARKLLEGEPLILIQNGKIYEKNMKKIRYNLDDLLTQLRGKSVFDLSEVEFAVLEPHGKLSVLKKSQNLPVTPKDLGLSTQYKGLSSEIIRDGRIVEQNLAQNNLTGEWLKGELTRQRVEDVSDIFLASLSTDGKLYIDLRKDQLEYIQKVEDDNSVI